MAGRRTPSMQQGDSHETPMPRKRATTIVPDGRLVLANSKANSRLLVYMIGNYVHRLERERRDLYFGDLDLARVAEIIGTAGVEPGMRDAAFREQHRNFDSVIGVEGQRAVNATSIASATGIPRETVRRKLQQLLRLGFIIEKGRARYILKPGVMQQPARQAAFARGIQQTVHFMNECLEHGVLQWVPAGKTKRSPGNKAGSE
jgi:biotin operon repressor